MSTATKYSYPPKLLFIPAVIQNSGYKMEGSDTMINYAGYKNIITTDRSVLSEGLVEYYNDLAGKEHLVIDNFVVKTKDGIVIGTLGDIALKRFIRSSSTIWKAEQDKRGIVPTNQKFDRNNHEIYNGEEIWMLDGRMWVDIKSKPSDKGLYLYLMMHNQNLDFPFREDSFAAAAYRIHDMKKKAVAGIDYYDLQKEASDIIGELRNKGTKTFDTDKMNFYRNVFREQLGGLETDEEVFFRLLDIARDKPKVIIDSVDSGRNDYIAVIQEAMALNILVYNKARMQNTLTQNDVVKVKIGANNHDRIQKLVDYYSSKDGGAEFDQLKNSVKAHKKELTS